MKKLLSKTLIGILFLTGICVIPITTDANARMHANHDMELKGQMQTQDLACCESHEKEANSVISFTSAGKEIKVKLPPSESQFAAETQRKTELRASVEPTAPPTHKYLASIIRLE